MTETAPLDLPDPWVYDTTEAPAPSADTAAIGAAIDDAMVRILTLRAAPIFDSYLAAMAVADTTCPAFYDNGADRYWKQELDCVTFNGATFRGSAFTGGDLEGEDGDPSTDSRYLYASARIEWPDGRAFVGGGSAYDARVDQGDGYEFVLQIHGSFAWGGPESMGTWMTEGFDPDVDVDAWYGDDGSRRYVVEGGWSDTGAAFAETAVTGFGITGGDPNACDAEPTGIVSLRDDQGYWYDVAFDADQGGACDGCGMASYRGTVVGEVCADFSPLVTWEPLW